jgi:hypothetical protein
MPEIGIEVTLAELYEGVDFSAATAAEGWPHRSSLDT